MPDPTEWRLFILWCGFVIVVSCAWNISAKMDKAETHLRAIRNLLQYRHERDTFDSL